MESRYQLHHGDCLEVLKTLPDCSIDAVVTDPPYGLSFMGKRWDYDVPAVEVWQECLRVLRPGGHLLSFAGTRTQHRMAVRIEDAGFEIRDLIAWVYGSGFPKSLDISKAIDKEAGLEREKIPVGDPVKRMIPGADQDKTGSWIKDNGREYQPGVEIPATEAAKQWQGWGTALKPAFEPVTMARKPFASTVAANVLEHGTGGLNVDGCRVGTEVVKTCGGKKGGVAYGDWAKAINETHIGRWPANFIHDGSEEVVALFPETTSGRPAGIKAGNNNNVFGQFSGGVPVTGFGDSGSAARFFYTAKASKADRDAGCEAMSIKDVHRYGSWIGEGVDPNAPARNRNHHPTVKPTDLMRYLCRLVTPPGGIVLDPFTGSGSTGKAAILEGFRFIGIEREAEYIEIARARIQREAEKPRQPTLFD
jgi:DNA modification methylase